MSEKKAKEKRKDERDLSKPVTREEFIEVMEQVSKNINDISTGLMDDMNTLFQRYSYPTLIKLQALTEILKEKELISQVEVAEKAKEIVQDMLDRAKKVDEEGNIVLNEDEGEEKKEVSKDDSEEVH